MHVRAKLMTSAATLLAATALTATAYAQDAKSLCRTEQGWETYHGSYKSWHYSPLTRSTPSNVEQTESGLDRSSRAARPAASSRCRSSRTASSTTPAPTARSSPLNGATGEMQWSYIPKLDEEPSRAQTHSPYNRGIAMGDGNLYVGTVDGRLIALDMKTGKPVWDTKLINSQKLTVGFTGAPLLVKDKVIIGSQGGEWPDRGPIFGVDAKTGEKEWEFLTVAGTAEAMKTWGNETWRTGGGGGWMPGTYDAETNTVWWGTGEPGAALRLGRRELEDRRRAAGRQPLYHLGDRARSRYRQAQVLSSGAAARRLGLRQRGGRVRADRAGGKKYIVHPNKGGYMFVYDRADAKIENVYKSPRTSTS